MQGTSGLVKLPSPIQILPPAKNSIASTPPKPILKNLTPLKQNHSESLSLDVSSDHNNSLNQPTASPRSKSQIKFNDIQANLNKNLHQNLKESIRHRHESEEKSQTSQSKISQSPKSPISSRKPPANPINIGPRLDFNELRNKASSLKSFSASNQKFTDLPPPVTPPGLKQKPTTPKKPVISPKPKIAKKPPSIENRINSGSSLQSNPSIISSSIPSSLPPYTSPATNQNTTQNNLHHTSSQISSSQNPNLLPETNNSHLLTHKKLSETSNFSNKSSSNRNSDGSSIINSLPVVEPKTSHTGSSQPIQHKPALQACNTTNPNRKSNSFDKSEIHDIVNSIIEEPKVINFQSHERESHNSSQSNQSNSRQNLMSANENNLELQNLALHKQLLQKQQEMIEQESKRQMSTSSHSTGGPPNFSPKSIHDSNFSHTLNHNHTENSITNQLNTLQRQNQKLQQQVQLQQQQLKNQSSHNLQNSNLTSSSTLHQQTSTTAASSTLNTTTLNTNTTNNTHNANNASSNTLISPKKSTKHSPKKKITKHGSYAKTKPRLVEIVTGKTSTMKLQIFEDETARDIMDLLSIDMDLKVSSSQVVYEELPKLLIAFGGFEIEGHFL